MSKVGTNGKSWSGDGGGGCASLDAGGDDLLGDDSAYCYFCHDGYGNMKGTIDRCLCENPMPRLLCRVRRGIESGEEME